MKKKTREIFVEGRKYLYVINQNYHQEISHIMLKISLENSKKITCTFRFDTWEDAITGSPLLVGVLLKKRNSDETENFNLRHPKRISSFISFALDSGWQGKNVIELNGLEIMSRLGFEVSWLKPRNM